MSVKSLLFGMGLAAAIDLPLPEHKVETPERKIPLTKKQQKARAASKAARKARRRNRKH